MAAAHPELLWIVITSGFICAVMAMSIGANDVANAFSTSVGSGSLKLRGAVSIACVFEIVGAILLGGSVTDSIRTKVLNFEAFRDDPTVLAMGMMCSSAGATIWLVIATWFGIPVSTTHSIIGALAGFGVASGRVDSIRWMKLFYIILSWLVVPLIAVIVSCAMYILLQETILKRKRPFLIMWYGMWFLLSISSIPLVVFLSFENPLMRADVSEGGTYDYQQWFKASTGNKVLTVFVVHITTVVILSTFSYICSYMRLKAGWTFLENQPKEVESLSAKNNHSKSILLPQRAQSMEFKVGSANLEVTNLSNTSSSPHSAVDRLLQSAIDTEKGQVPLETIKESENHKTEVVFSAMQIIGAATVIISHSANDTANAVAPFATVLLLYLKGLTDDPVPTPWYVLLGGGLSMSLGLSLFGYKVIKNVGLNLARVTPSRGYTIDSTAGSLVLVLSQIGIPLSSTHCAVSSIMGVGLVGNLTSQEYDQEVRIMELKPPPKYFWQRIPIFRRITTQYVNMRLYRKIFITWITTMFFSGIMSSMIFVVTNFIVKVIKNDTPTAAAS
ncbi:phosphate transporter [Babesia gibsoni]|uniref:Phosphate transporter n=1 Tax=Babesia gibsoni TaxID=33632 RepID=A0AAD8LT53_BABGI|nr:phosphate transporter [Babesia gibsoni]